MGAEDFGHLLRRHRTVRRWSQPELARRAGVPKGTIVAYEAARVVKPGRANVVSLALALDWPGGPDAALALVGEGPLSAEERQFLPAPVDLFDDVTRIWSQLSPRLQAAVVELLNAICEPQGPANPAGSDPAARSRSKTITTPRESAAGTRWPDQSRW
jgi:transcriptional regulator with XRE-family HTH domain